MELVQTLALRSADPYEAWANGWLVKHAFGLCALASLYPLIMAVLALKNGGGGHWHCLWVVAVIGIFFRFFLHGDQMFALGVVWLLTGAFMFHGQRELHQMTDNG